MGDPVLVFAAKQPQQEPKCLRLLFYDVIGDTGWGDGITSKRLQQTLDDAGEIDLINVRVNSPGGITTEGFAIYNILKGHRARVEVDIDGDASSMASAIVQAGDVRRMADNAEMLVHEARAGLLGLYRASELASLRQRIESTNDRLVELYERATGQTAEALRELLANETTLTAKRAKELGFIDEVTTAGVQEAAIAWEGVAALQLRAQRAEPQTEAIRDQPPDCAGDAEPHVAPDVIAAEDAPSAPAPADAIKHEIAAQKQTQQQLPLLATLPPASGVTDKKGRQMEIRVLASTLGLEGDAVDAATISASVERAVRERNEAVAQRTTLLQAVEVATVEEAVGAIAAGKAALEQNRILASRVDVLERAENDHQRADVIAHIKADGKCTPAQEIGLFPTLSLDGLKQFEKTATRVVGRNTPREPQMTMDASGSAPVWNGKTFAELKPAQRAELHKDNKDLYDAMRAHALETGAL